MKTFDQWLEQRDAKVHSESFGAIKRGLSYLKDPNRFKRGLRLILTTSPGMTMDDLREMDKEMLDQWIDTALKGEKVRRSITKRLSGWPDNRMNTQDRRAFKTQVDTDMDMLQRQIDAEE